MTQSFPSAEPQWISHDYAGVLPVRAGRYAAGPGQRAESAGGWGADVISRIEAALHGSGDALAASVRAGVRALVLEMAGFSAYLR